MDPFTLIDLPTFQELKQAMGEEFILELVESYCRDTRSILDGLSQAQQVSDQSTFTRLAHSLKSTSLTFGALAFGNLARELEQLSKQGCLADTPGKLAELKAAWEQLQANLKELCNE